MYRWKRILERQIAEMRSTLRMIEKQNDIHDKEVSPSQAVITYIDDLKRWIGDLETMLREREQHAS
jgi:predicted RNase H-like nuclease (RuvC/YqgF family)